MAGKADADGAVGLPGDDGAGLWHGFGHLITTADGPRADMVEGTVTATAIQFAGGRRGLTLSPLSMGGTVSALSEWDNFYVIVGSSAAALTGLQFVVVTLVADLRTAGSAREINAFATPTIVHLGAVLLLSAVLAAPWHGLLGPAILLAALGLFGIVYSFVVARRTRQQTSYTLVLEDWLFHVWLPVVAYGALTIAPWGLRGDQEAALFAVGAAALLLLFIGIHNAWDTVTYIVLLRRERKGETGKSEPHRPDRDKPTEP